MGFKWEERLSCCGVDLDGFHGAVEEICFAVSPFYILAVYIVRELTESHWIVLSHID
jgi:hypothetical protein